MTITPETIRMIRRAHGLSHRKMAFDIGVSHRMVQLMEAGKRGISDKTAHAITEAYGLTPEKMARIEAAYNEFLAR
ncbi:DNA-binding protein [Brevibacillus panacihumi W25]|uniref:DNA-binding protein n=1 Tax=Brevibacillus panacihumi W25 TaxID=1408254 RepID=V6MC58_9BACL|nr:helix-turn-helix transcriptional regulator [Brevibacillus panacihumi]EST55480.1 DNA-binding protein [Brevibacillus panacihumi W25]